MAEETNEQLLRRYRHVKAEFTRAVQRMERLKPGVGRDRAARWAGCLNFTLLGLQDEVEKRGLV